MFLFSDAVRETRVERFSVAWLRFPVGEGDARDWNGWDVLSDIRVKNISS